ncbi:homocysteine S-methyltransferase [Streptomyces aculeolatus]|uniref:homocysteine S-methyltransferase n=1 Tax=Streptomyces aculeolatus TaxID=270689 RepID=UPI001CEC94DD|nr:homocysteine S-methyltransferase [Streptomyces aculeolatus]
MPFAAAVARAAGGGPPLVLDGGLSNQLEAQGCDLRDALWSARVLAEEPAQIEAAHAAYVRAGADVLLTASYQATFEGFARRGTGRQEAARLLTSSVTLARRVADEAPRPVWVAASAGPYGAMLADGSEYHGRYGDGVGVAELTRFHRPRLEVLAAAEPDVLALETVPGTAEAEALLRAAAGLGVPAWLSYTVAGGRTRAGEPLADAFALAADEPGVAAVGVNCCAPEDVPYAVETAARVTGKPVVAYPNSGEGWSAGTRTWRGPGSFDPAAAPGWRRAGAAALGGCCRVGPESIAALAAELH